MHNSCNPPISKIMQTSDDQPKIAADGSIACLTITQMRQIIDRINESPPIHTEIVSGNSEKLLIH